jgi:serine/threonine protein kinase/Tol biopolymer transport system component
MNSQADNQAQEIKAIFLEALDREAGAERRSYLDEVCGSDTTLRGEVEALLLAHENAGQFLDPAAFGAGLGPDQSSLTESPGTVIGRYRLLEKIGEGGMAVVYMAQQTEPIRRKVALKIIKLGMDTRQVIARFEAERQALALMDHPSIAKVLDAGATETGRPYFVMELVQGVSITEYCDNNSLNTKDRLALFLQVCHAVQHAHQKGIIHRDIKPSNVMVTHHDGQPIPKVIDFGIAKATNQRLTEETLFTHYAHIIGTPAYMSPEQAELTDLDIDTRSDIYSLGVLLYELLTGTTPFSEKELRKAGYVEMQRVIREQEPIKPSTKLSTLGETLTDVAKCRNSTPDLLRKTIRGDLDWIVMKSLEKDRARRYETASGLVEDIRRHLENEPVLARAPTAAYRTRKFFRRHQSQVLVALMMVTAAAAAVVMLSQWNRDRRELRQTEGLRDAAILSQAQGQYAKAEREAALETITALLGSEHAGPEARLLQATILVDNRRSDEAATILNGLLDERPEVAGTAHSLLARILWESESLDAEKLKEIEEHRRQAEAVLPETAEAYFLRAMTAITVKEQLAALDKALELDPKHYESRRLRTFTYCASRKYDRMDEDAYVMEALHDQEPLGYSLRALALRELGRYKDALTEYEKALALTPTKEPQYLDLATQHSETLLRTGDYKGVLAEAQEYVKLWPEQSIFPCHIFCALTALGDYQQANDLSRQILQAGQKTRVQFQNWCAKWVSDSLQAGRSWHPANREPVGSAFLPMVEAEETYRRLSAKGRRVIADGFSGQWSPDGKRLAFSLGVLGRSGIAVFDPATNQTDLLIVPGKHPRWSPNGKYIAFVRDRQFLRVPKLVAAAPGNRPLPIADDELWLMKADGTEPRRLARGVLSSWAQDSNSIFYRSHVDNTLCSVSVVAQDAEPKRIRACPGDNPLASPDSRYLAYTQGASLKIQELSSATLVAEWSVPLPTEGWFGAAWSPSGRELCMGGSGGLDNRTGLWIYRLGQREPVKTLGGPITMASWSRDGTKLVFGVGSPYFEIWTADLAPDVSVVEALGPTQTLEEHFREMLAFYTRRIDADPQDAHVYSSRAACYDRLHARVEADADMKRWSAVMSGKSPSDVTPADADLTFGEPANLDSVMPFLDDACIECLSADDREMFICSARPGGSGDTDIWVLKRSAADQDWGAPENLGPLVNSARTDAASCISADGLELYFNSDRSGGHGNYDLYVARRTTRSRPWDQAVNLGRTMNTSDLEAFPRLSADGLELYFMSGRPGGYGGFDLYVSRRVTAGKHWGDPANLGPVVNSPYCETGPCLSADGLWLFFQDYFTPRPGGYGAGDLWMTRRASRSEPWGPPVNLGPRINGPAFDHRPCLAPDGSALYFGRLSGRVLTHWKAPIIPAVDSDPGGKAKEKEDSR